MWPAIDYGGLAYGKRKVIYQSPIANQQGRMEATYYLCSILYLKTVILTIYPSQI